MVLTVLPNISVLVSVWMETLFYGVYLVVFATAVYFRKRATKGLTPSLVIVVAFLMFAICTAHIAINLRRLIEGFILTQTKPQTLAYFYQFNDPLNVAKQFLWIFNNILADCVLVWRLWVVWNGNLYVCIGPIILLLGTTGFGLATAESFAIVKKGDTIFIKKLSERALGQYSLTLANNLIITGLIAGRVWYLTRNIRGLAMPVQKRYSRVILMIVESGMVYAFCQIIQLSFYAAKFPGLYFVADSFIQIFAIVPTSIIIFVGMNTNSNVNIISSTPSRPSGRGATHPTTLLSGNVSTMNDPIPLEFAPNKDISQTDTFVNTYDTKA